MAQVCWSLTAGNGLQGIEDFIARSSVLHAITFIDRIFESADILLKNSYIRRIVPEFNRSDLREVLFGNYRIVSGIHIDARIPGDEGWQASKDAATETGSSKGSLFLPD